MSELTGPRYRVQLPPDARHSEWRSIDEPIRETYILSIEVAGMPSEEEYSKLMGQLSFRRE